MKLVEILEKFVSEYTSPPVRGRGLKLHCICHTYNGEIRRPPCGGVD